MGQKLKSAIYVLAIVMFSTMALSQGVTEQIQQDPFGAFYSGLDGVIEYESINSFSSVLIYVLLPGLGLYAIFSFIFRKAFGFAAENFRNKSGYGSSGIGKHGKKMSRYLAIATSAMSLIFFGGLFIIPMILAGIAAVVWFVWALFAGVGGTWGPLPFGTLTGDSGSSSAGNGSSQEVDNAINTLASQLSSLQEEIEDLKAREDQTESEENSGEADPEEVTEEIEIEINEMEDIVEKLEKNEKAFEQITAEVEKEIQELENEEEIQEKEIQDVEELMARMEEISGALEQTANSMVEGEAPSELVSRLQDAGFEPEGNPKNPTSYLLGMEEQLGGHTESLSEFEDVLEKERDERQKITSITRKLESLIQAMSQLQEEVREVELLDEELEDEEKKAEKLAKRYHDKTDLQRINSEEKETAEIEQEIKNNVIGEFERMEREAQNLLNEVENIERFNEQELNQIEEEFRELEEIEAHVQSMEQVIAGEDGYLQSIPDSEADEIDERITDHAQKIFNTLNNLHDLAGEIIEESERNAEQVDEELSSLFG